MGELLDAVERARQAQQKYERRIPVQLEIGGIMPQTYKFEVHLMDENGHKWTVFYNVETFAQAELLANEDKGINDEIIRIDRDYDND